MLSNSSSRRWNTKLRAWSAFLLCYYVLSCNIFVTGVPVKFGLLSLGRAWQRWSCAYPGKEGNRTLSTLPNPIPIPLTALKQPPDWLKQYDGRCCVPILCRALHDTNSQPSPCESAALPTVLCRPIGSNFMWKYKKPQQVLSCHKLLVISIPVSRVSQEWPWTLYLPLQWRNSCWWCLE
jgi:hypothetical protein